MRNRNIQQLFHPVVVLSWAMCVLWVVPASAQERAVQNLMTVEEAVKEALEQNPVLKVEEQEIKIARGELLTAALFENPELELQAETDALFSNEGERTYSIGLSQKFFVGSKRRHRIGVAERALDRTKTTIEDFRRLLVAEVKEVFYTTLLLQEQLILGTELIEINERLVTLTKGRFREGFSPELDVNLAKIQLQQAKRMRTEIEKELSISGARLNLLLGRPTQTTVVAQGPFQDEAVHLNQSQLRQAALDQRADLTGQELTLAIAGKEIDLARAERIPDVTLSFDYAQERTILSELSYSDTGQFAGLKLSIPIPLFDRNQGGLAQAKARQEKASRELSLLRVRIESEVTNAMTRVQAAQQTLRLFGGGILPLAESHLRLTQAAYEQGLAGILDVMEAQRRFSETRLGSLEALYEYNLALTEVERVAGTGPVQR